MTIRQMEERDVERILSIQAACPEIAQWTAWDYGRVARGEMAGWVGEQESGVVGFLVGRRVVNEIEILNFAVSPEARAHGIGTLLLQEAIRWGTEFGAVQAILEVRASNASALRFYERHNFQVIGRRARYYNEPKEDALLLKAKLA
ncbi:MAG TPA: ribosomal protein S18-alanine N-acetyltransferase [Candidatus Acidoferrales bacterium]|nr:ribosomal protein S18-alanine N-acetyltransferase [Candidatus Acidoferrales bacterium]